MNRPVPAEPVNWQHYALWKRVKDALYACPDHFTTPTVIEGLLATDIFTLNTPLAATIEESVVGTLNAMRPLWEPRTGVYGIHVYPTVSDISRCCPSED